MTPETLEALKGSIEKWRRIVEEGGEDNGAENCPLCRLFNTPLGCEGCPVQTHTGREYCAGSPYHEWEEVDEDGTATTEEQFTAARAELEFLRSLLPKEEGQA